MKNHRCSVAFAEWRKRVVPTDFYWADGSPDFFTAFDAAWRIQQELIDRFKNLAEHPWPEKNDFGRGFNHLQDIIKDILEQHRVKCPKCVGTGEIDCGSPDGDFSRCDQCGGSGEI